jgi:hypothetical protein
MTDFFEEPFEFSHGSKFRSHGPRERIGRRAGGAPADRTCLGLAARAHQRLGEPDVEGDSQGNCNRCAEGCGRTDVGGGISRRDTGS